MRKLAYIFIAILLTACVSELTPEEQATEAALKYYNSILEGNADGLLAAKHSDDTLCPDYHRQLRKVYAHYFDDLQKVHQGVKCVRISENKAKRDSLKMKNGHWEPIVYAFLMLTFNDSTEEEISVPMVQRHGEWIIK